MMTMSDNELLLAISNMLDDKLDAKLDSKLDSKLDAKMKPIEKRLTKIEAILEHNILPRLQNIESCYVATYERYQNAADRMEGVVSDVELLKRVVAEHSEKLNQAIS